MNGAGKKKTPLPRGADRGGRPVYGLRKQASPDRGMFAPTEGGSVHGLRKQASSQPGHAPRLGQPSMADSPPQAIHGLLSACPGWDDASAIRCRSFSWQKAKRRWSCRTEPRPGGGRPRRARHGWRAPESGQGEHGPFARHCRAPVRTPGALRRAGHPLADALTEGKAAYRHRDVATLRSPHERPASTSSLRRRAKKNPGRGRDSSGTVAPRPERCRMRRNWRPGSELNRRTRICSPLHNHSATRPGWAFFHIAPPAGSPSRVGGHEKPRRTRGFALPGASGDACRSVQAKRLERETRLELATPTLARSCSTN